MVARASKSRRFSKNPPPFTSWEYLSRMTVDKKKKKKGMERRRKNTVQFEFREKVVPAFHEGGGMMQSATGLRFVGSLD